MRRSDQLFAVDRIEGRIAVLIGDEGASFDVEHSSLPPGTVEGSVLRVPGRKRKPDWSRAVLDEDARRRRREAAELRLTELRKRDPGGDLKL